MIGGERPKLSNRITDYKRKKKGKRFILYKKGKGNFYFVWRYVNE